MEKDFVIDKIEWHVKAERNYDFDNSIIYEYFKALIVYLQKNNLTTRIILPDKKKVDDETCIKRSDLTLQGFKLIQLSYSRWVDKVVDRKISSSDYKILDAALKKIGSLES